MMGDRLVIYDPVSDRFFAGRNTYRRIYADRPSPPKWTKNLNRARISQSLTAYKRICAEIGNGVRVINETEARRIVTMRMYRQGQDNAAQTSY